MCEPHDSCQTKGADCWVDFWDRVVWNPDKVQFPFLGHPFKMDFFGLFSNLKCFCLARSSILYQHFVVLICKQEDKNQIQGQTKMTLQKHLQLFYISFFTNGTWKHLGGRIKSQQRHVYLTSGRADRVRILQMQSWQIYGRDSAEVRHATECIWSYCGCVKYVVCNDPISYAEQGAGELTSSSKA